MRPTDGRLPASYVSDRLAHQTAVRTRACSCASPTHHHGLKAALDDGHRVHLQQLLLHDLDQRLARRGVQVVQHAVALLLEVALHTEQQRRDLELQERVASTHAHLNQCDRFSPGFPVLARTSAWYLMPTA